MISNLTLFSEIFRYADYYKLVKVYFHSNLILKSNARKSKEHEMVYRKRE